LSIAFVRQSATFTTTSATITAGASGNTLVLIIASQRSPSARTVSSLSCTNVTWANLAAAASGVMDAEIWYGTIAGGSSGTTVTITMSGASSNIAGSVSEFSGILTSGTINDGTAQTKTATGTAVTTTAYSAALANDLVIAIEAHATGTGPTVQPGGSYANLTFNANSTTCGVQGNYILHGVAGAQSATWTIGSALWVSCIGALKVTPLTSSLSAATAAPAAAISKTDQKPLNGSTLAMAATLARVSARAFAAVSVAMSGLAEQAKFNFTSKTTGNWSTSGSTTWNQAGIPGSGNTVLIQNTHNVTVDVNESAGNGSDVSLRIAAGGILTIADAVTLAVNGNVDNQGDVELGAGSQMNFASGTVYSQSLTAAIASFGAVLARIGAKFFTGSTASMSAGNIKKTMRSFTGS